MSEWKGAKTFSPARSLLLSWPFLHCPTHHHQRQWAQKPTRVWLALIDPLLTKWPRGEICKSYISFKCESESGRVGRFANLWFLSNMKAKVATWGDLQILYFFQMWKRKWSRGEIWKSLISFKYESESGGVGRFANLWFLSNVKAKVVAWGDFQIFDFFQMWKWKCLRGEIFKSLIPFKCKSGRGRFANHWFLSNVEVATWGDLQIFDFFQKWKCSRGEICKSLISFQCESESLGRFLIIYYLTNEKLIWWRN